MSRLVRRATWRKFESSILRMSVALREAFSFARRTVGWFVFLRFHLFPVPCQVSFPSLVPSPESPALGLETPDLLLPSPVPKPWSPLSRLRTSDSGPRTRSCAPSPCSMVAIGAGEMSRGCNTILSTGRQKSVQRRLYIATSGRRCNVACRARGLRATGRLKDDPIDTNENSRVCSGALRLAASDMRCFSMSAR